jgi:hypothetical protein
MPAGVSRLPAVISGCRGGFRPAMIRRVTARSAGPPPPRLASIRSRWLTAATASLRADPAVLGSALVGSLGAGHADDWSDIDLLIVVDDECLAEHAAPGRLTGVQARPG